MAFCESAQRDCRYLDIVELSKSMFLIDRATKDDDHARYAEKMDKSVSSVENAPNICDENHCSIVAGILVQTIVHGAHIETLEDFSKGEL